MSKHTKIRRVHLKKMNLGYNLKVKFNSYKDGCITFDIIDNNDFCLIDAPLIEVNYQYIKNNIVIPISKILHSNEAVLAITLSKVQTEVTKAIDSALKLLGTPTHDYDVHECQALVSFGNYPDVYGKQ